MKNGNIKYYKENLNMKKFDQRKVFLVIERSIDGWLSISTEDDEKGDSLEVPYDKEFFNFLISHLKKVGMPSEMIKDCRLQIAARLGKSLPQSEETIILKLASIAYPTASEGALDAKPAAVNRKQNVKCKERSKDYRQANLTM